MPEARINASFRHFNPLFKLNRPRWLPGAVVHDAVDVVDFVDDTGGDAVDQIPRQVRRLGGHEVAGRHSAERNRVVIGSEVAHNADGAHVGECREVLA